MKTLILFLLALSLPLSAKPPKIVEILQGKYDSNLKIIKYEDGTVEFKEDERSIESMKIKSEMVSVDTAVHSKVATRPVTREYSPIHHSGTSIYNPTVLLNYSTAQNVMDEFRKTWVQGSQCYDRAHIWVYEENFKYGTNLMKAFLFFSDDYIERYKFPWWFHIAPYAYLKLNGELTERILDPMFAKYPLKFKLWTDLFMKNKVECKSIEHYSEFSENPHSDDCFIQRTTMHYWQPKDLEALEESGIEKSGFFNLEVQWAYDNAFKN